MEYFIKIISDRQELASCPKFYVNRYNWGGGYRPSCCGSFAYADTEKKGFYLQMTCEEANPVCRYHKDFEPVWMDSAMEGFFAFDNTSNNYINLEINSAGAIVASFGSGKTGRRDLSKDEVAALECQAHKSDTAWSIELFIPIAIVQKYFGKSSYQAGDIIRLNFFKLAEGNQNTHFASFAPIRSPEPNFHLPEFFADGKIIRG